MEGVPNTITAVFRKGPLGIKFNHEGEILAIRRGTQADAVPGLMDRDLLISVEGVDTRGISLKGIRAVIADAGRPATFVFARHKVWDRSGNGLPRLDRDMLLAVFTSHDKTGKMKLDCDEFYSFMVEIHRIRTMMEGKDLRPLHENAKAQAQHLIDAHDDNEDGRIHFTELQRWLDDALMMGVEERREYANRGGYCPHAVRFVEDIAIALQVSSTNQEESPSNAGTPTDAKVDSSGISGVDIVESENLQGDVVSADKCPATTQDSTPSRPVQEKPKNTDK